MSNVASDVYAGLAEVGFPLTVVASVATSLICGAIIYMGIKMKRGLVNPPPDVPGKAPMSMDEKGNLLIGVGIFLIVVSWLWTWLAYRYKTISAISAIGSLFTLASSLFHMRSTC